MPSYQCPRCGHIFYRKNKYNEHTKRKNICKFLLDDVIPVEENYIELQETFKCKYCNKEYSQKNDIPRHYETCKEIPEEDKKQILEKKLEKMKKKIGKNNGTTNIQNITINDNSVNINNTINIYVNDFKNTDCEYIGENKKISFLSTNMDALPKLIQDIHFNPNRPQNHNMYITNYKDKIAKYKQQGKWFTKSGSEFVDDLIVSYDYKMFREFEDNPKTTHIYQRYIAVTEPKEAKEKIKDQIYTIMYNHKDMVLETDKNSKKTNNEQKTKKEVQNVD